MNPERVCRVCLIVDVKMYDLKIYPLKLYFEPFILTNPLSVFDLPNMVCYQCASLIKKFYLFREKCIKGQTVLYRSMDSSGLLDPSLITTIDRKELKLASNLDFHTETPEKIINYIHEKDIKNPQLQTNNDLLMEIHDIPYQVKTEIIDDLKIEETDLFDYPFEMASSDDEPLSKHKSKKKKKKKMERQKEKEGVLDDFLGSALQNAESLSSAAVSTSNVHKGRGRPKKIAIKLADIPKELDELNSISGDPAKLTGHKTRGRPKKEISAKPIKTKVFDEYDNVEDYAIAIRLTPEEQLEEVTKRQTSSNYLNSQYKCDICFKGYMNTDTWRHHMDKHDPVNGEQGSGKSLTLAHLIHYAHENGFVLVHIPWVSEWLRRIPRYKEMSNSSSHEGMVDIPLDAASWLLHFKSQNLPLLTKLDLRTTRELVWSKREKTDEGAPLLELIEHGITRVKFACDVIDALLQMLKEHSDSKKCKTFVAIDGFNCFFYPLTRLRTTSKREVKPDEVTLTHSFMNITKNDWTNGVIVVTADELAVPDEHHESFLPKYQLFRKGFEHLDPFDPVQVNRYTEKEFLSCASYYRDRLWLRGPEELDTELQLTSAGNPYRFMELCAPL